MKTHILATISVLLFIGIFFWALHDPKSFLLVLHGLLAGFVIITLYFLAYNLWKDRDNCNDYVEDTDKLN